MKMETKGVGGRGNLRKCYYCYVEEMNVLDLILLIGYMYMKKKKAKKGKENVKMNSREDLTSTSSRRLLLYQSIDFDKMMPLKRKKWMKILIV